MNKPIQNYAKTGNILILLVILSFAFVSNNVRAQSAFEDPSARTADKGADLVAVEPKIDAGAVALGSDSQVVILLRNDSGKPITSGAISLYPSSNVSATVGENECNSASLPPSAVCAIAISVKGLQVGRFRIEMLMRHDGRSKLITTTISGTVERSSDDKTDIISDIEILPTSLDFETLKDSRPLTRSIVLRNVTSKEIDILSMEIESNEQSGYSLKSECEKLLSGEACLATVTWAPQQRGPATGVMVVKHTGPTGVVSIILDGEYSPDAASEVGIFPEAVPGKGLLTASQSEIDFGSGISTTSSITASLVNVGDAPLKIEDISLSNKDSGIKVDSVGCKKETILQPVEACPLTLTWSPVRAGSILDDVQIKHDGARGILVLPVRGQASEAINQDTQTISIGLNDDSYLSGVPPIPASMVQSEIDPSKITNTAQSGGAATNQDSKGSLDGFKVTSLSKNRAIISGPGGSRVVSHNQETVIGAALWRVVVRENAVELVGEKHRAILLFDPSLSLVGQGIPKNTSGGGSNISASPDVTPTTDVTTEN